MKVNVFTQQLISHVTVILAAILLAGFLFSHFFEQYVYDTKTEELTQYGQSLLSDLGRSSQPADAVLRSFGRVLKSREIEYSLFDEQSKIIYSTGLRTPLIELDESEWTKLQDGETISVRQEQERFSQAVTFVLLPYFQHGQFVGGVLLTSPIGGTQTVIAQMNRYLVYAAIAALAAAVLLSGLFALYYGRRIRKIRRAASAVSSGDYSIRLATSGRDEIDELAADFNAMVRDLHASHEEIENLENRRRQFMADVSHELRTPLTTIRGTIEGLQNDMIPNQQRRKALGLAGSETKRLLRLVNENLDYEKIRSNQITLVKQEIRILDLFEIVRDQLEPLAEERRTAITVQASESMTVHADYDRLTQILLNITKNSIQFTEDGTIALSACHEDGLDILEIEDTGIGMTPEEVERIWSRFYKAVDSRASNPYGESGLGLSIVRQLVSLHGGTIDAVSRKGQGTRFVIRLPHAAD
ncbi:MULTISPECIES: sensor histidine kinase [Sporosarcina]|uniref:sensor histidine kinase n=1 Tax=Sporosarcina TaxID=1569 RepID=UPI00058CD083|nr:MULTISPECIES: HAMP domain-containing sensor histidine kinase [Sporosarcina]WJY26963.1 HAMP domain-containing sensor histidine kinase [Sporosarcina sp. 0.2-SM1T-5]